MPKPRANEREEFDTERGVLIFPACEIRGPTNVRIGLACSGSLARQFRTPQGEATIEWLCKNASTGQTRGASWNYDSLQLVIWVEFTAASRRAVLVATKRFRDQLAEQRIQVTQLPITPPCQDEAIEMAKSLLYVL